MRIMFVFILKQESVQFPKLNLMHSDVLSNTGAVSKINHFRTSFFFNVVIVILIQNTYLKFYLLLIFLSDITLVNSLVVNNYILFSVTKRQ